MATLEEQQSEIFAAGLEIRKQVLGKDYVEASIENAGELGTPLQKLVTEYCWGTIWTRPGLDKKTRSLLNLAMLTALNRPHEIRLHMKGAVNNGCTAEEIMEVILQSAIYCGVPAAIDSMKIAKDVLSTE